ncbi:MULTISPECIES: DUF1810 domain-containing protein [unclassified Mycolicibacterium]|uniref:DUF1810 domain-containing protein n=1 Tax=unclassified Mycolicibacterium TaxID=2636767 RepID=UPI0012DE1301|nr:MULTISPECIES: DUF1810 domain-containing protein [unclassified Mycolicibacterium]MUL85503.1 DUF1810 domain-containing protein [Mycolicibacterium sp. CBMA 329]MUL88733.1 DUF1810 domain-containing protein [Mycolicibacterium sp. CBMA 331]MUM01973.1 DUF1810 domain-containing protein [Mycolicibacterium sp. CBMA 334]MUM29242.1 DUF1810 domain-containing protein [Mycolicibacterium sp. CBMA 295]MUM40380.1 DUF1810 domain-containing protein [Mycolicibacterium sp. CBMA 247]
MVTADDLFDLRRFTEAQERVYPTVLAELRDGRKRSHWIWFIFPQLRGLGRSSTAHHYGIASRQEASAYLVHDVLGPRLRECARLVAQIDGRTADEVFGWPDCLKVRSSMTLFAEVTEDNAEFVAVLDRFYGGDTDPVTLEMLTAAR